MESIPPPPTTEDELVRRARSLAGWTASRLAERFGVRVPKESRRAKGWLGTLVEQALGATASSRPVPDFPGLGVELKTLPVDDRGRPLESTYVCTLPLGDPPPPWESSWVRHKLWKVLWIPVVCADGARRRDVADRVLGAPVLWSPDAAEVAVLRSDWDEIAALVREGALWQLDGRVGRALQVRPKAASGRDLTWTLDEEGEWARTMPRGFYLRPAFTGAILARHLALPAAPRR